MRSFTELYLSPFWLCRVTARMPLLNSQTGRHVWPPKSSFSDMSYSWTSIRSSASSGTVSGNSNVSFHEGNQLSSIALVFLIIVSLGTPAIPTCKIIIKSISSEQTSHTIHEYGENKRKDRWTAWEGIICSRLQGSNYPYE